MTEGKGAGRAWIGLVVGLLAACVAANVALLRVASADESVAWEPDYWTRAQRWDEEAAARARSARLGWTARVLDPERDASGALRVGVELADDVGQPVRGATVTAEAFAIARASDRLRLQGVTDEGGRVELHVPDGRSGLWELRLEARRAADTFVATHRVTAPAGPP